MKYRHRVPTPSFISVSPLMFGFQLCEEMRYLLGYFIHRRMGQGMLAEGRWNPTVVPAVHAVAEERTDHAGVPNIYIFTI